MNNIHWLASYPKSGNTWMRIFLINLLYPNLKTEAINELGYIPNAGVRSLFDEFSGINSSDLTNQEVEQMRPEVYEAISNASVSSVFLKIHDTYSKSSKHVPLVSKKASKSIIYLIRNPLDIAISFAEFKGVGVDQMIQEMEDTENTLAKSTSLTLKMQLPQRLSSWSQHVIGWTQQRDIPIKVIRYEDLLKNPFFSFKQVTQFLELNYKDEEIRHAIEKSKFARLKEKELRFGFKDKFPNTEYFFRKGIQGEGLEKLSTQQIDRIKNAHGQVMATYNYLHP